MVSARTYYKALVLLVVFSMNTLVSFACSLGGFFHSLHHQVSTESASSHHSKHQAHQKTKSGHHHDHGEGKHHDHGDKDKPAGNDNCCSDSVVEVEKTDKSISRTIDAPKALFLASFLSAYYPLSYTLPLIKSQSHPPFVRWRVLATIPDLRIAIQSFQI